VDLAQSIGAPHLRSEALVTLAPYLDPPQLREALQLAHSTPELVFTKQTLLGLIDHLPQTLVKEAEAATKSLKDPDERDAVMTRIATRLVELGDPRQALKTVRSVQARKRDSLLMNLVGRCIQAGYPKESLAAARMIKDSGHRATTLAGMAPELSQARYFAEAWTAARSIGERRSRAQVLTQLAADWTEPLRSKALRQALSDARKDWVVWDDVLRMYRFAPTSERRTVLRALVGLFSRLSYLMDAIVAIQALSSGFDRNEAVQDLTTHLPDAALEKALSVSGKLKDSDDRSRLLQGLALRFAVRGQAARALEVVHRIKDEHIRADALVDIAPYLPEDLRQQALETSRRLPGSFWKTTTTGRAIPRAEDPGEPSQAQRATDEAAVVRELERSLAAALRIGDEGQRARLLAASVQYLPEELREDSVARLLDMAKTLDEDSQRQIFISLAAYLPEPDLPNMLTAPVAARHADVLAALAPRLSATQVRQAIAIALKIDDQDGDKPVALIEQLARLAALGYPDEALDVVRSIKNESTQARVLSELARHLPPGSLRAAWAVARRMAWPEHRDKVSRVLVPRMVASGLEEPDPTFTESSRRISSSPALSEESASNWLLQSLRNRARHTPTAFADRLDALISYAELLTASASKASGEVVPQDKWPTKESAIREHLQSALLLPLLEHGDPVRDDELTLVALVAALSEFPEYALEAIAALDHQRVASETIAIIAHRLPERCLDRALEITRGLWQGTAVQATALRALARQLAAHDRYDDAISTILLVEGWDVKPHPLHRLLDYLLRLPPNGLFPLWRRLLRARAQFGRKALLLDLEVLLPVTFVLAGERGIESIFNAVQDIGRWWP